MKKYGPLMEDDIDAVLSELQSDAARNAFYDILKRYDLKMLRIQDQEDYIIELTSLVERDNVIPYETPKTLDHMAARVILFGSIWISTFILLAVTLF